MQQSSLFTWFGFRSAYPSKVAQFSVGANTLALLPLDKSELELAEPVAQHHEEACDVRVREREGQR